MQQFLVSHEKTKIGLDPTVKKYWKSQNLAKIAKESDKSDASYKAKGSQM